MKQLSVLFAALLVLVGVFTTAVLSQSPATIVGQLRYHSGSPVANQPVVIEGKKARWWFSKEEPLQVVAVTDSNGYFKVLDLPPGHYDVKIVAPGIKTAEISKFEAPFGYHNIDLSEHLKLNEDLSRALQKPNAPSGATIR